ncbi:MAG TPA: DUF3427 domain-containing protein [Blastocatellia bacterium]|nr:DUF3427 domain-containing protein [Blastocatellia bacterium]
MKPGLYEQLLTLGLEQALSRLSDPRLYTVVPADPDDAHWAVAQYIEHLLASSLTAFRGVEGADRQMRLANRIIQTLINELGDSSGEVVKLAAPLRRLLAVYSAVPSEAKERPDTPLARSALLTGTRLDPSLGSQLRKEIASADRLDILCSFIRWSGLRVLLGDLRVLASRPSDTPRIRVITTSYMGATDPRAVEVLSDLPNTEVRVSYDTKRTRLHAKAYIFHRETDFDTAYIGSANISNAALSEGLEWTTKVSRHELPYLWAKITGSFENYWEDDEFEPYVRESGDRLREAIVHERAGGGEPGTVLFFDLRPFPFQEEILDIISAEREIQKKCRHLVVAATGTGKTMIAAFDYSRRSRQTSEGGGRPSLLFVAHREEILKQALGSFRGVLRDQNFGDLLVGGRDPGSSRHLFCSIQSYNSRELWRMPADNFSYVVVDEFHHAAAPSYRRLLEYVRPEILLGLTATPERSDQLDVLAWFDGHASAEIRLPDAINRRLLCPFQYFGIADSVDLDGLTWQRGGYKIDDLDRVYTGNDVRALLIIQKVSEILLNPRDARGLGFCVSIAHANYMARFFSDHGLAAIALTADSVNEDRTAAQAKLRAREISFIFVVDLYNEGVDIPEIDTVLFLRPTESLTVYLQQFGRGLRLHPDKDCLTVLDFIGAHRKEFRFAPRLRALSTKPTNRVDKEIELGFPHLPSGCVIQLERIAQQRVLENVRASVVLLRSKVVGLLRDLGHQLGRQPSVEEALDYLDIPLDVLLTRGMWSELLAEAGLAEPVDCPDREQLFKGVRRICHLDDADQIIRLLGYLDHLGAHASCVLSPETAQTQIHPEPLVAGGDHIAKVPPPRDIVHQRILEMLHVSLWGERGKEWSLEEADRRLRQNPAAVSDLCSILEYKLAHAPATHAQRIPDVSGPLTIHSQYTRDEILVGLGHWSLTDRPSQREGVLHLAASKVDAFFVTLQKSESDYSPTTMYEDYLISHELFHWQSQSNTSETSTTGQRYINHQQLGYTPLLFVRETKTLPSGLSAPYAYLGPCEYVSHEGSRPMSIIWRLSDPVPARLFRLMARQNIA